MPPRTGYEARDDRNNHYQKTYDIEIDIVRKIIAAPATTVAGLEVKALVAIAYDDESIGCDARKSFVKAFRAQSMKS